MGLYLDVSSRSLYIANSNSHNIVRWVVSASTWTLIAGNGNGQAGSTPTTLNYPTDIAFDYMGNLYVADSGNDRIQLFLPDKFNGTTIAGITDMYTAAAKTFSGPQSVTRDSDLNLYVSDSGTTAYRNFNAIKIPKSRVEDVILADRCICSIERKDTYLTIKDTRYAKRYSNSRVNVVV